MKRHYTNTANGVRCVSCRQEFADKSDLSKHYVFGKCVSPLVLGLTIDLNVSPYYWVKAV